MAEKAVELLIDGRLVRLSSPDKMYFDDLGVSKLGVAQYFQSVGAGIVGALRDRPTTMERWPGGVRADVKLATRADGSGEAFFQKRAPSSTPDWVQRVVVKFPSGRTAEEIAPADLATIIWMVNLGTVRFHPWPVVAADPGMVDQLRIDLDPQPGVGFETAVMAALELRGVLEELGLTGFCKTSGGRGVHVYAPIEPMDFVAARHSAISIGRELARRLPNQVTVNWWKEERGARVFVDFNQMAPDRLMTSAYSIRPTPAGLVSAPVEWEELASVKPSDFTIVTMPARFAERGDVWAPMATAVPGSLAGALEWYDRDAAAGEGELPYPPEYPKMPGEPPRVQPSRARRSDQAEPGAVPEPRTEPRS
jgi:DNA ligase D-like protein (predicted polymerase)